MRIENTKMISAAVAAVLAGIMVTPTARAAAVDWSGFGGDSTAGGSWEAASPNVPWSTGTPPATTVDVAGLLDTATNRVVTIDSAEQIEFLAMTQTSAAVNTLRLNANLTLTSSQWNGYADAQPVIMTPTAGVSSLVLDLNGSSMTVSGAGIGRINSGTNPGGLTLNGTVNVPAASVLTLQYTDTQSGARLTNLGVINQNGAGSKINIELTPTAGLNNDGSGVGRKFDNQGVWTLSNGAEVTFTVNGVPYAGGFSIGAGNTNSGTMNVLSNSSLMFGDMTNTGTMTLGSGVKLGVVEGDRTLNNGTNGLITISGDTTLGNGTVETGGTTLLNNGSGSATGAQLKVGNGSNSPTLTVVGGRGKVGNFAGNSLAVAAGATLAIRAFDDGQPHPYNARNATLINRGTTTLAGKLQMGGNHDGVDLVDNFGTFTVSGAAAVYERLANASGYYGQHSELTNEAGATLGGAGTLTYVNSTGNTDADALWLTNAGTISPGNSPGELSLVNTKVVFQPGGKLLIEVGGESTGEFDVLSLSGIGAALDLTAAGDILEFALVDGYLPTHDFSWAFLATPSLLGAFDQVILPTAPNMTFSLDTSGAVPMLSVTAVPEPASMLLLGLGGLVTLRRRRRA